MAATAPAMGMTLARGREVEATVDPFAPDVPMTWRYGVLRYADEKKAYRLTRWREVAHHLRESLRHWWYDRGKQPIVSEDPRKVFNDERQTYDSYAEARAWCHTVNCYVVAMPHGGKPLGDELFDNPTFVRPLLEPEKDAHLAALYAESNLRAFICADLWAENQAQRAALDEMERRLTLLAGGA